MNHLGLSERAPKCGKNKKSSILQGGLKGNSPFIQFFKCSEIHSSCTIFEKSAKKFFLKSWLLISTTFPGGRWITVFVFVFYLYLYVRGVSKLKSRVNAGEVLREAGGVPISGNDQDVATDRDKGAQHMEY